MNQITKFVMYEAKEFWKDNVEERNKPKKWVNFFFWIFIIYLFLYELTGIQGHAIKSLTALALSGAMWIYKEWVRGDWRHYPYD